MLSSQCRLTLVFIHIFCFSEISGNFIPEQNKFVQKLNGKYAIYSIETIVCTLYGTHGSSVAPQTNFCVCYAVAVSVTGVGGFAV